MDVELIVEPLAEPDECGLDVFPRVGEGLVEVANRQGGSRMWDDECIGILGASVEAGLMR